MTSFIRQTPLRFGKNQVRMRSLVEVKVTKLNAGICIDCQKESIWRSLNGRCWQCTVAFIKNRPRFHISP